MTLDEPGADKLPHQTASPSALATTAPTPSHEALQRYGRRMRRSRAIYFGVIAAVLLAVGVTVGVVWSHGESAHTTLRTAGRPAPSIALGTPSVTLHQAWHSTDRTAIGTPYWGGTVVTYSADSVRGRNASSGAIAWSYTRTDRTVCQAIQIQGITVAIFEVHGNCDQVTALDSGTGKRRWTRTLDKDGQSLDGRPSYGLTESTPTLMLTTPGVIYAIDPVGGLDRWVYHRDGCTIHGAVIGAQGALISQTCAKPKCDGLTFCGSGPQLLLRDGTAGRNDDDKANPDRIAWDLIGTTSVPASADAVISAVDTGAGQLQLFEAKKGKTLSRRTLSGGAASVAGVAALPTDRAELLWIAGTTYAVPSSRAAFLWSARTAAPPSVTPLSTTPLATPDLRASSVATAGPGGIALLDPGTGKIARTFPVAAVPAGSLVYPFGTGFVLAGASTTVYR